MPRYTPRRRGAHEIPCRAQGRSCYVRRTKSGCHPVSMVSLSDCHEPPNSMHTKSTRRNVAISALTLLAATAVICVAVAENTPPVSQQATQAPSTSVDTTKKITIERPVVYIASPYTKGDPAINTHFQCKIWNQLMDDGLTWPVAPLWSHFQHTLFPRRYQDWVAYDHAMIQRYDACLRLESEDQSLNYHEGRSSGADEEVAEFKRLGKPVFYSIEDLYTWVRGRNKQSN